MLNRKHEFSMIYMANFFKHFMSFIKYIINTIIALIKSWWTSLITVLFSLHYLLNERTAQTADFFLRVIISFKVFPVDSCINGYDVQPCQSCPTEITVMQRQEACNLSCCIPEFNHMHYWKVKGTIKIPRRKIGTQFAV